MNENTGWIKLHRAFLSWEWFDSAEMIKLFIYLLLMANHDDKKWRGVTIKRGQLATGLYSLSEATNLSVRKIRTCLARLQETGEIDKQSNNQYSIITICNYETYQEVPRQSDKQNDKRTTNERQTNDNKQEFKEDKELKNKYISLVEIFNKITNREFRGDSKSRSAFNARIKQGYTLDDFEAAITAASQDRYLKENPQYLTPEYITRENKLQQWMTAFNRNSRISPTIKDSIR